MHVWEVYGVELGPVSATGGIVAPRNSLKAPQSAPLWFALAGFFYVRRWVVPFQSVRNFYTLLLPSNPLKNQVLII